MPNDFMENATMIASNHWVQTTHSQGKKNVGHKQNLFSPIYLFKF